RHDQPRAAPHARNINKIQSALPTGLTAEVISTLRLINNADTPRTPPVSTPAMSVSLRVKKRAMTKKTVLTKIPATTNSTTAIVCSASLAVTEVLPTFSHLI